MRRLIFIYTARKCVSEFTWCQKLPDFTLVARFYILTAMGCKYMQYNILNFLHVYVLESSQ